MSNIKKETITKENILSDIKQLYNGHNKMNSSEYRNFKIFGIIIAVILIILEIAVLLRGSNDSSISIICVILFLPIFLLAFINVFVDFLIRTIKKCCVRMDDYEIVKKTLSHRVEEKHTERVSKYRKKEVTVYTLHFEGNKSYRIPIEIYLWTPLRRMSDASLYNLSHRGDEFLVVQNKKNGKIEAVYPDKYFEYKA